MVHLFIAYSIPVSTPYLFVHNLSSAIPAATSSATSAIASVTATAGLGSWLKKVALRAAGEEGLAENVRNQQGEVFGIDAIHAAEVEKAQEELRYKTQYQTINCIDTSGQVFAILLNFIYLAPLLLLFVRFFLKTYLRGSRAPPPKPTQKQLIRDSGKDAARNINREIKDSMDEQGAEDTEIPEDVKFKYNDVKSKIQKGTEDLSANAKKQMKKGNDAVKEKAASVKNHAKKQEEKSKGGQSQQSRPQAEDSKMPKNQPNNDSTPQGKGNDSSKKPKEEPKSDSTPQNKNSDDSKKPKEESSSDSTSQNKDSDNSKKTKEEPKSSSTLPQSKDSDNSKKTKDLPNADSIPQTQGKNDSQKDPSASAYEINPDELKTEEERKAEEEMQPTGEENDGTHKAENSGLDESAYEINVDEIKSEEEMKAETEMQPKQS